VISLGSSASDGHGVRIPSIGSVIANLSISNAPRNLGSLDEQHPLPPAADGQLLQGGPQEASADGDTLQRQLEQLQLSKGAGAPEQPPQHSAEQQPEQRGAEPADPGAIAHLQQRQPAKPPAEPAADSTAEAPAPQPLRRPGQPATSPKRPGAFSGGAAEQLASPRSRPAAKQLRVQPPGSSTARSPLASAAAAAAAVSPEKGQLAAAQPRFTLGAQGGTPPGKRRPLPPAAQVLNSLTALTPSAARAPLLQMRT